MYCWRYVSSVRVRYLELLRMRDWSRALRVKPRLVELELGMMVSIMQLVYPEFLQLA